MGKIFYSDGCFVGINSIKHSEQCLFSVRFPYYNLFMASENLQKKICVNFHLGSLQGDSAMEVSIRSCS